MKYFLTVAQEENISHAADILHVTQPTLSRQLADLEYELGVKLFRRGNRRITLTESGLLLRRRAEEVLTLIDKIELTPFTSHTITSKEILLEELDVIRQQGYSTENRELGEFTFCYGVPVLDYSGRVIAAISLSDIVLRDQDSEQMVKDLQAVASEIAKTANYMLS